MAAGAPALAAAGTGSPLSAASRALTAPRHGASAAEFGDNLLVGADRLGLLAVLLGAEREIEARLRLTGLFGQRPIERLARLVGDHAASRGDQSLPVGGAAQRVLAVQAERLGIGVRGVAVALEAHVDRSDHAPALAVVGLGDEPRLDRRDRRLDLAAERGPVIRAASG